MRVIYFESNKVSHLLSNQPISIYSERASNLVQEEVGFSWHTLNTHADHPAKFLAETQRMHKAPRSLMSSLLPQLQTKKLAIESGSPTKPLILVLAFGMPLPLESIIVSSVAVGYVTKLSHSYIKLPSPRPSSWRLIQHRDPS